MCVCVKCVCVCVSCVFMFVLGVCLCKVRVCVRCMCACACVCVKCKYFFVWSGYKAATLVFIYRPVSKSTFTSSKHIPLHMLAKGEKNRRIES